MINSDFDDDIDPKIVNADRGNSVITRAFPTIAPPLASSSPSTTRLLSQSGTTPSNAMYYTMPAPITSQNITIVDPATTPVLQPLLSNSAHDSLAISASSMSPGIAHSFDDEDDHSVDAAIDRAIRNAQLDDDPQNISDVLL